MSYKASLDVVARARYKKKLKFRYTSNPPLRAWPGSIDRRCPLVDACRVSRYCAHLLQTQGQYTREKLKAYIRKSRSEKLLCQRLVWYLIAAITKSMTSFVCWKLLAGKVNLSLNSHIILKCLRQKDGSRFCIILLYMYYVFILFHIAYNDTVLHVYCAIANSLPIGGCQPSCTLK